MKFFCRNYCADKGATTVGLLGRKMGAEKVKSKRAKELHARFSAKNGD
jgi:hypothetical protein